MYKKLLMLLVMGILLFGVNRVFSLEPVDAGNKICPVTSEEIDEKTKATYEYNGKIYNFCCPMCIDEFKKDPEEYIKKIEEEAKEAEPRMPGHEGHHHSH